MRNALALGVHAALTDAEIVVAPEPQERPNHRMSDAEVRKVSRTDEDIWERVMRRQAKLARRGRLAR